MKMSLFKAINKIKSHIFAEIVILFILFLIYALIFHLFSDKIQTEKAI